MSLKYTANFAWDLSLGQIRTSGKDKKGVKEIFYFFIIFFSNRYFKSQTENYKISVSLSGFMYVSVYVLFFFW